MSLIGGIKKKKECTGKNIFEGLCISWQWYFALRKETEVEKSISVGMKALNLIKGMNYMASEYLNFNSTLKFCALHLMHINA